MENPEEILHSLEEFSKLRPKDIPRELEDYLCFVAKTGDPVYQWSSIKSLFREKLVNVITEFYESCPSVDIPPCPNVELFNYEAMKSFILEKLDTFSAAPFTVQRLCELLTTPRKEYNRIDKFMRAIEKNILVVSTTEPRGRRERDGVVNGLESDHANDAPSNDINVEEMDDMPSWPRVHQEAPFQGTENGSQTVSSEEPTCSSVPETLSCTSEEQQPYVSIEPVASDSCSRQESAAEAENVSVTITAIPAGVQKRRSSIEPVVSSEVVQASTSTKIEDPKSETTEEPTVSTQITEPVDSTSTQLQITEESSLPEDVTPTQEIEEENIETNKDEKACESSENAEVSSSVKAEVVEDIEQKAAEEPVISSSEEVTNEASTSEDKVEKIEDSESMNSETAEETKEENVVEDSEAKCF